MASITLRPRREADEPFLQELYASTRAEEMALTPWPEETKRQFLMSQYSMQKQHYDAHYPGARFAVIERDRIPIGRLYTQIAAAGSVLIDISLLPEYRGQGIGTPLLRQFLHEAGTRVTCHVENHNPARRLYQRLGFRETGESFGPYVKMEWTPGG